MFPNQVFRYCETKNFRRKNVIPPFSSIKLFGTRNFLKNSRIPLRNFPVLWDKKFGLKIVICPLLSIKIYSIPKIFFWKTEGFVYKAFRFGPVRQKVSTKPWSFPPPLLENFRYPKFSDTPKCSPTNFFGTVWQKVIDGVTQYPSSLMLQKFRYPKFSDTPKCSPTKFFGTVRQKIFDGKTQYPSSLMLKNFRYPKFPDAPKCSPTKFFGTVRQKILTENRDMPPLIHKHLFDTKKFLLENRRIPLQSFSFRSCETKNFDGKSWYPPPPRIHNFFPYQKNSEKPNGFLAKFFRSCEMKNIFDKTVKLSFAWKFSIPEFFRNTEMFSYEFYRHCETKIFQRSLVISPSYA